jgi:exopolysaccharide production protein ExoQ
VLIVFLPAFRAHHSIAIPAASLFVCIAIAGGVWLAENADAVLASFGSDSSLTGRDRIWDAVMTMIGERPWLGYGFAAFWRGVEGPSAEVWAAVGTTPPHAHNGLLDVWLQLGFVGVAAAVLFVATTCWRSARLARREWSFQHVLPLLLVAFIVFFNFSETTFASGNSLYWLLLVYVAVACGRELRSSANAAPSGSA